MEIQNTNSSGEVGFCSGSGRLISFLLSAFIVGAVVGVVANPYLPSSLSSSNKSYKAGFNDAKKLAEDSSVGNMFKTQNDVRKLSGAVSAVNGNQFTLKVNSTNPFDDPAFATRTVLLNSSTKVVTLTQKSASAFQLEVDSFLKAQAKATTSAERSKIVAPSPYISSPAKVEDIVAGDSVNVLAGENIKTSKQFTATEIQILPNKLNQ